MTTKDKVLNWYLTGQIGASSRAMATHLCGAPCDGSYPHDPDDLNRCLLFLDAVPEARTELPRMAEVNKRWAALIEKWDEIEASFLAEAGLNWCHSNSAPNTFRLMTKVLDSVNRSGNTNYVTHTPSNIGENK